MWSREDVAWAAGVFEGEGFVGTYDYRSHRPSWMMSVEMTDEDVVRKLHRVIGLGKVYGPIERKNGAGAGWLPTWKWQLARRDQIYAVCAALFPFMGKRRRARMAQAIQELPPVGRTRRKM